MKTSTPIVQITTARCSALSFVVLAWLANPTPALAQSTAFTYQGRLTDGGAPARGIYDLWFAIYDMPEGGAAIAGPVINAAVAVSNGLLIVALDFGNGVFSGPSRWLELGVRTNGSVADFIVLSPRQSLTPAPYSIHAANSSVAASVTAGSITSAALADGAVTALRGRVSWHDR